MNALSSHANIDKQILMSVLEKVQAIRVSRDVSTIQEDSIALALRVLNLSMMHNAKVRIVYIMLLCVPDYFSIIYINAVLPTVPVTLSPFQMDNAVVISLSSFSVEMVRYTILI